MTIRISSVILDAFDKTRQRLIEQGENTEDMELRTINGCDSIREALIRIYHAKVRDLEVQAIEDIQQEFKSELWQLSQEFCTGNREDKVNYCRAVWLLTNLRSIKN